MSTKAIEEVIVYFKSEAHAPGSPRDRKATQALAELDALRKAAKVIAEQQGWIRSNASELAPEYQVLVSIAKENEHGR